MTQLTHRNGFKSGFIFKPGCIVAALLALTVSGWQANSAPKEESPAKTYGPIAWTASLTQARKTAKLQHKPILIDLYAEWCGPCKEMLRTTYKDKQVVARSKQFVPVLINVDKQPEVAAKYGVEAIPTVIFLNSKGNLIRKEVGFHDTDEFLKLTADVLKQATAQK
jgi:thiol:disulfide interchange protein DsbD